MRTEVIESLYIPLLLAGAALLGWMLLRSRTGTSFKTFELSPEQIAYRDDPRMLITCAHLRPMEQAARAQGLPVRLLSRDPAAVWVDALDAGEDAVAFFDLAPATFEASRVIGPHTNTEPIYRCPECGSRIEFSLWGHHGEAEQFRLKAEGK